MRKSMLVLRQVFILLLALTLTCAAKTEKEIAIEKKLNQLNKPAVKSIQSEDGDIIDCVDIYKQPAFDNPLLKNHTILMKPSKEVGQDNLTPSLVVQLWSKSGSCPEGTIPIRRTMKKELMNAISLENYGKKPRSFVGTKTIKSNDSREEGYVFISNHSLATLETTGWGRYTGAKAIISVWNPRVEKDDEYSSGQIWLATGDGGVFNAIETGWMVNPSLFGDRKTRLFTYWTGDGGWTTGCFNLLCAGFVQTSRDIAIGATLWPISVYGGVQHMLECYVFQDERVGVWWLQILGKNLGYWPNKLFDMMSPRAPIVRFGGDVYSPRQSPHTATQMGSGNFSNGHNGRAGWVQLARVQDDTSSDLKYPPNVQIYSPHPQCYDADIYEDVPGLNPGFYFGGPGRSGDCP